MEIKQETVTLSLDTYKEMEQELKALRTQVKRKTVIKNVIPPIYAYAAIVIYIGSILYRALFR